MYPSGVSIPQSGFGAFEQKKTGCSPVHIQVVSIPQSGFGAFELLLRPHILRDVRDVSIPQSGFGAFEPVRRRLASAGLLVVSIPQSGFGAFEQLRRFCGAGARRRGFQSLSRDSGHLNSCPPRSAPGRPYWFQSLSRDSGHLNFGHRVKERRSGDVSIPQSGFGAFEPPRPGADSGTRSPVSIPQSGFGAFERRDVTPRRAASPSGFNPSVGIRGI